jgi:hypothetical protein
MIPTDTLDSLVLREIFSKMMGTTGFKLISYGLSIVALSIAAAESYSVISGVDFLPVWSGAFLAVLVLVTGFSYAYHRHNSGRIGSHDNQELADEFHEHQV